ncbi:MAG TPA: hypothetical protein VMV69_19570 [Pirellulales bacterium]|nr:hypothetical protein [Pirellulales bacterium]
MLTPRFQFRLNTMLVALATFLVWLGFHAERSHRQRRAVAAIVALGGHVSYQCDADTGGGLGGWFERRLGKDFVRSVSAVFLAGRPVDAADLECLAEFPSLETVNLASSPLTDAGLEHLTGLKRLRHVDLRFTQVSEDGVRRLRAALPDAKIYRVSDIE